MSPNGAELRHLLNAACSLARSPAHLKLDFERGRKDTSDKLKERQEAKGSSMPGEPPRSPEPRAQRGLETSGVGLATVSDAANDNLAALELDLRACPRRICSAFGQRGSGTGSYSKRIAESRNQPLANLNLDMRWLREAYARYKGRLLGHSDRGASLQAFHRALELFEKNKQEFARIPAAHGFGPIWGIAFIVSTKMKKPEKSFPKSAQMGSRRRSIRYLGYSEWTRGDLAAAQTALRKGLENRAY